MDTRPVRRVQLDPSQSYATDAWPYTLPAVQQLLTDGLDLPAGVTLLVGENGSGESTLVEAIAQAYGLNAEGGSRSAHFSTRTTESSLAGCLELVRSPGHGRPGYFLRAETMHAFYTYNEQTFIESNMQVPAEELFHELSHGESFLALLRSRFQGYGFFLMDEPEAALSFQSCLALVALLDDLRKEGAQALIATHSPLLAALPGANVLEVGTHGIQPTSWGDLDLVRDWRGFLQAPERWLRHLLEP